MALDDRGIALRSGVDEYIHEHSQRLSVCLVLEALIKVIPVLYRSRTLSLPPYSIP